MALAKPRVDELPAPSAAPAPLASAENHTFKPAPSPALTLQKRLLERTAEPAVDIQKWSPRSSLALIVSASIALWLAILMGGAEVAKLIA